MGALAYAHVCTRESRKSKVESREFFEKSGKLPKSRKSKVALACEKVGKVERVESFCKKSQKFSLVKVDKVAKVESFSILESRELLTLESRYLPGVQELESCSNNAF